MKDFFRKDFEVTYAEVSRDRDTEGLVDFASRDDMLSALEKFDGVEMRGNPIKLLQDKGREEVGGGGGSYGGGDGYGSRNGGGGGYGGYGRERSRSPPRRGRSRSRSRSRGRY